MGREFGVWGCACMVRDQIWAFGVYVSALGSRISSLRSWDFGHAAFRVAIGLTYKESRQKRHPLSAELES